MGKILSMLTVFGTHTLTNGLSFQGNFLLSRGLGSPQMYSALAHLVKKNVCIKLL